MAAAWDNVEEDGLVTTRQLGEGGEDQALRHLTRQGLCLIERNYQVAQGPYARGGEIDLIMQDRCGTLVFIEVRSRSGAGFGGALSSITPSKRRSIVFAAQRFLQRYRALPPCRFDVVAINGHDLQWIVAAFDAQGL